MKKNGIAPIMIILIVLAVAILVGGVFYYVHTAKAPIVPSTGNGVGQSNQSSTQPTTSSSTVSSTVPIPPVMISSLTPANGPVGTTVTIRGMGFGADNTIEMGGLVGASMKGVASADGKTLQFTVPQNLGPDCNPGEACPQFLLLVTPKAYVVSVITNGATQNVGTFTVTAK